MTTNTMPDDAVRGIGQRLRTARESAGMSLTDASAKLKMQTHVVDALEREDWGKLGAPVYIRGQLRSYAKLLGLPADAIVDTVVMPAARTVGFGSADLHAANPTRRRADQIAFGVRGADGGDRRAGVARHSAASGRHRGHDCGIGACAGRGVAGRSRHRTRAQGSCAGAAIAFGRVDDADAAAPGGPNRSRLERELLR